MKVRLKGCSRCLGDLAQDWDSDWRCLQCGRGPSGPRVEAAAQAKYAGPRKALYVSPIKARKLLA